MNVLIIGPCHARSYTCYLPLILNRFKESENIEIDILYVNGCSVSNYAYLLEKELDSNEFQNFLRSRRANKEIKQGLVKRYKYVYGEDEFNDSLPLNITLKSVLVQKQYDVVIIGVSTFSAFEKSFLFLNEFQENSDYYFCSPFCRPHKKYESNGGIIIPGTALINCIEEKYGVSLKKSDLRYIRSGAGKFYAALLLYKIIFEKVIGHKITAEIVLSDILPRMNKLRDNLIKKHPKYKEEFIDVDTAHIKEIIDMIDKAKASNIIMP